MAVGTAAYAAPEQLMGEPIDGRADQYALACTAFHLLTGAPPYDHPNLAVVITHHVSSPPPSIGARRPELAGLDLGVRQGDGQESLRPVRQLRGVRPATESAPRRPDPVTRTILHHPR